MRKKKIHLVVEVDLHVNCFNDYILEEAIQKFTENCSIIIGSNTEEVEIINSNLSCYQDIEIIKEENEFEFDEEFCDCGHIEKEENIRIVSGCDFQKDYSICSNCFNDKAIITTNMTSESLCQFVFTDIVSQERILIKKNLEKSI